MRYFCPYRRDVETQFREGHHAVMEYTKQRKMQALSAATPVELAAVLPAGLKGDKCSASMIDHEHLQHAYRKELKHKHQAWENKHLSLRHQWKLLQEVFRHYGGRLLALKQQRRQQRQHHPQTAHQGAVESSSANDDARVQVQNHPGLQRSFSAAAALPTPRGHRSMDSDTYDAYSHERSDNAAPGQGQGHAAQAGPMGPTMRSMSLGQHTHLAGVAGLETMGGQGRMPPVVMGGGMSRVMSAHHNRQPYHGDDAPSGFPEHPSNLLPPDDAGGERERASASRQHQQRSENLLGQLQQPRQQQQQQQGPQLPHLPALFQPPYVDAVTQRLICSDDAFVSLLLAQHSRLLLGLNAAQLGLAKLLAEGAISRQDSEGYRSDVELFSARWRRYFIYTKRREYLEKLRADSYDEQERMSLQALAEQKRHAERRLALPVGSSSAPNEAPVANNNRDAYAAMLTPLGHTQARVSLRVKCCGVNGVITPGRHVIVDPNEPVGQFLHRALQYLQLGLEAKHKVLGFIDGGPQLKEDLQMGTYNLHLISGIKLVITRNPFPAPETPEADDGPKN